MKFPILSDPTLATIQAYGIEQVGESISLPATYVIDTSGAIVLAYVGDSPRDRPKIEDVLAAIPG